MHSFDGLKISLQQWIEFVDELSKINPAGRVFLQHLLDEVCKWLRVSLLHSHQPPCELPLVHFDVPDVGTVFEYLLVLIKEAHGECQQTNTEDICLLLAKLRFLYSVFEAWKVLRRQVVQNLCIRSPSPHFCLNELQSQLIIALADEDLTINQHKTTIIIYQQLLRPKSSVGHVKVVQEVYSANDMVDHANYFNFLVVDIDNLPTI